MIQIEVQLQVGVVDARHEFDGVLRSSERRSGVIHCKIEVFKHEHRVVSCAKVGESRQGVLRGPSFDRRHVAARANRLPVAVETRSMNVQSIGVNDS
ncbi:unannotated protein [freshwater metagenome]|uniref:Unannotated protein n=1 Tax=freshwater metagenome TaxID=449393 RepID=A0A6J6JHD2_9ZZZZ